MNYNKVTLAGRITRDIELKYTPKGTAVAEMGLATNRTRKGANGKKIEEVTFVDVTLWGRTAEVVNQYLGKGSPIFVEGRLATDSWTDKETGKNRSRLKVVADGIQFIDGGNGVDPKQESQPTQRTSKPNPMSDDLDQGDDIPF